MMGKKAKKSDKIELEQGGESVVNSEHNELVDKLPEEIVNSGNVISEDEGNKLAINHWIGEVEQAVTDEVFRLDNTQSHRILSATLNMLKSARDHLGDR